MQRDSPCLVGEEYIYVVCSWSVLHSLSLCNRLEVLCAQPSDVVVASKVERNQNRIFKLQSTLAQEIWAAAREGKLIFELADDNSIVMGIACVVLVDDSGTRRYLTRKGLKGRPPLFILQRAAPCIPRDRKQSQLRWQDYAGRCRDEPLSCRWS
jgi:hypothetical protein